MTRFTDGLKRFARNMRRLARLVLGALRWLRLGAASPTHASALYLLIATTAATLYLVQSAFSAKTFALSWSAVLVLTSTWVTTAVVTHVFHYLSRPLQFFGIGSDLRLAASTGVVLGAYALLRFHFALFHVHLWGDAWDLAIDGIAAGDIEVGTTTLVAAPLVYFGWIVVGVLFQRVIGKITFLSGLGRLAERARVGFLLFACLLVGFEGLVVDPKNPGAKRLREQIPWWAAGDELSEADANNERTPFYQELKVRAPELVKGVTAERRPNIVFIIMESFRWDLVNAEVTPNLHRMSKNCLTREKHYSNGTNTSSGLSALLHGLNSYYYDFLRKDVFQPIPFRMLGELGYRRSLFRSVDLKFRNIQKRFFAKEFEHEFAPVKAPEGDEKLQTEIEMFETYLREANRRAPGKAPFFDVVLAYATHWSYYYTPEFEKFTPVVDAGGRMGSARKKYARELKNRQKNAALYLDHWIAKMQRALERKGITDTIWMITGDHGEEFFEQGRFGHTWGLNDEMVRVPLLLCLPEARTSEYAVSAHDDVFPTIFDYMGLNREPSDFMTGKSLLDYDAERDFALVGVPFERSSISMAIVDGRQKVHFRRDAPTIPVRVFDAKDKRVKSFDQDQARALLERVPRSWELGKARHPVPGEGNELSKLRNLSHSDLLDTALHLERVASMFRALPKDAWTAEDSEELATRQLTTKHAWRVRAAEPSVPSGGAQGVAVGALESVGSVGALGSVAAVGEPQALSEGLNDLGVVEFFEDGTLALGPEPWHTWQIEHGELLLLDREMEPYAVLRYSKRQRFVGVTRHGTVVELSPHKQEANTRLPKRLWSAGKETKVRPETLLGTWSGSCFGADFKLKLPLELTFSDKGRLASSAPDAAHGRGFERWVIRDRTVHAQEADGHFTAALFYDGEAQKLVSVARGERYCELSRTPGKSTPASK